MGDSRNSMDYHNTKEEMRNIKSYAGHIVANHDENSPLCINLASDGKFVFGIVAENSWY